MGVNWACYIAWQSAENEANKDAQNKTQSETAELGKYLQELEEISKSRGG